MAEDWRDQRYRPENDRGWRRESDHGNDFERRSRGGYGGEYGGSYDPARRGAGYPDRMSGGGGYGSGRDSRDWQDRHEGTEYGRRYAAEGRGGAGPVSEGRWSDEDRDFSNDWGTGVGDMYGRDAGYGSRRGEPGFPSFGQGRQSDVGYGSRSGDAYQDYGGRRYGTQPNYRDRGEFLGRQGAFIGRGGYAGEPVDHFEEHGSGSGYASGGRRADQGWFGGPTGHRDRPSWQTQGEHSGRGPRDYRRSDHRIQEDVNDRLSDDPWVDASDISVEVKDGEVTLSGMVDSRDAKRRAEDCAESVSGVRHCQNNLRVRSQDMRYRGGESGFGPGDTLRSQSGQQSGERMVGAGSLAGGAAGIGGTVGTTGSGSGTSSGTGSSAGQSSGSSATGSGTGSSGQTANRQH